MNYTSRKGWFDARIVPYSDLSLDPAALVLHYSQEIFEGLKAYRLENGGIALFRPEDNIKRMNSSAHRMCMPRIDPTMALEALRELVLVERQWIPSSKGTSLYLRPTMIATDAAIGMRTSDTYLFYIIA
ncbi:branched chain amino acid aminotransferase, partial [Desulfobacterales bacterium]|nr:branched chain amino acid aminotransferase [Desulfobacterales bacterium]